MTRQEANRAILNILSQYVEDYPDIRFHQMLHNLNLEELVMGKEGLAMGCKDLYYLESVKALERIAESSREETLTDDDKDENGKIIPLSKRKSISFRQIIAYDERLDEDPDEMEWVIETQGSNGYDEFLKHYDLIENEIMIARSPDWGMESGWQGELEYHFACGPHIFKECVSDTIYIDWYIEQVAERAGFKNKIDTQLAENYHGILTKNTYEAEKIFQALIDGFKQDGFKVIETDL